MVPNQSGVADPAPQIVEEQEKKKLGTLKAVEQVVNEYAKKYARRFRVADDEYKVLLVTEFKGIMGLRRGPVVQIILLWPDAQPNINTLLESAFRTISRNRLVDTLAVESVMHIRRRADERRKWVREQIHDEADIILDLIPKHRVKVTQKMVTEYEDVVTGEKITITHQPASEYFRGQDVSAWLQLSRIVRDKHPEEATRYVESDNGTRGEDEVDVPRLAAGDGDTGRDAAACQ
jgi:DNA-directed RNA polymerase subunit F